MTRYAGIVLAGGESSRMGSSKAALEWHGSTLLRRVAGVVARGTGGPVVVVRAAGQALPPLPPEIRVVEDEHAGRGPLEGIATGMATLAGAADVAFVATTDAALLHPVLVRRIIQAVDDDVDIAIPHTEGRLYPLTAAYRTSLLGLLREESAAGRLRVSALPDLCRACVLTPGALLADPVLAAADPALESLANINTPEEYAHARAREQPEVMLDGRPVRAAMLGTLGLDPLRVELNGVRVAFDPELPLAAGDIVRATDRHPADRL